MATAPVVIPYAQTVLVSGLVVDTTNTTTAQALFTVPSGMRCVVTGFTLRNPNALMTAARTFSIGFNAAGNDVIAANTGVTLAMAATGVAYTTYNIGAVPSAGVVAPTAPAAGSAVGKGGDTLSLSVFSASAGASAVKMDVYGYLVPA